jgi:hypothetical protein
MDLPEALAVLLYLEHNELAAEPFKHRAARGLVDDRSN